MLKECKNCLQLDRTCEKSSCNEYKLSGNCMYNKIKNGFYTVVYSLLVSVCGGLTVCVNISSCVAKLFVLK